MSTVTNRSRYFAFLITIPATAIGGLVLYQRWLESIAELAPEGLLLVSLCSLVPFILIVAVWGAVSRVGIKAYRGIAACGGLAILGWQAIPTVEDNFLRHRESLDALANQVEKFKMVGLSTQVGPFRIVNGEQFDGYVLLRTREDGGLIRRSTSTSEGPYGYTKELDERWSVSVN